MVNLIDRLYISLFYHHEKWPINLHYSICRFDQNWVDSLNLLLNAYWNFYLALVLQEMWWMILTKTANHRWFGNIIEENMRLWIFRRGVCMILYTIDVQVGQIICICVTSRTYFGSPLSQYSLHLYYHRSSDQPNCSITFR